MSLLDALLLDPYKFNIWIALRADGLPGSGTQSDPYDGTLVGGVYRFDEVMTNKIPSGAVQVNLGPGEFETRGYNATDGVGWTVREKMTIAGSGMDVTTLKLVGVSGAGKQFYAIGHALGTTTLASAFSVFDLTIDCNLPVSTTTVACGAVRLMGSGTRVQRVKAIHWGTNSASTPCYVFALIAADPANGVWETSDVLLQECIAVEPSGTGLTGGKVKVLHVGSRELSPIPNIEGVARGPVIRNCYVDCGSPSLEAEFQGISMGWCQGGVVEGNHVVNTKHGGPYQDVSGTPDIVVRNNFYRNVYKGPCWKLGKLSSSIGAATLSVTAGVGTVSMDGAQQHHLAVGDRVWLAAVDGDYAGLWQVSDVISDTVFQFVTSRNPPSSSTVSAINKVMALDQLIVEQNVIQLAPVEGEADESVVGIQVDNNDVVGADPSIPAYVHLRALIRDNRIGYVSGSIDPTFADYKGWAIYLKGIAHAIVRENVVDLDPDTSQLIRHTACGSVTYFDNTTSAGVFVPGYEDGSSVGLDGLEDLAARADDVFVMAFLGQR